jgi:hypothetical protein
MPDEDLRDQCGMRMTSLTEIRSSLGEFIIMPRHFPFYFSELRAQLHRFGRPAGFFVRNVISSDDWNESEPL